MHSDEKREQLPGKEECMLGNAVYKENIGEAWNEKEEGQIQAEECQKEGGKECRMKWRSANLGSEAPHREK